MEQGVPSIKKAAADGAGFDELEYDDRAVAFPVVGGCHFEWPLTDSGGIEATGSVATM